MNLLWTMFHTSKYSSNCAVSSYNKTMLVLGEFSTPETVLLLCNYKHHVAPSTYLCSNMTNKVENGAYFPLIKSQILNNFTWPSWLTNWWTNRLNSYPYLHMHTRLSSIYYCTFSQLCMQIQLQEDVLLEPLLALLFLALLLWQSYWFLLLWSFGAYIRIPRIESLQTVLVKMTTPMMETCTCMPNHLMMESCRSSVNRWKDHSHMFNHLIL